MDMGGRRMDEFQIKFRLDEVSYGGKVLFLRNNSNS